jgi:hypothetical protein
VLEALGYELPDRASRGVSQSIYVGDPAKRAPRPQPRSVPVFIRSQPGPNQEFEIRGGKLRVIAVEFYDSAVAISWRVLPPPDVVSVFPGEVAALERDVIGVGSGGSAA